MSWVKVDDQFPRHRKVQAAGAELGRNGIGRVMAVWLEAACYTANQLTDGFIPTAIVRGMTCDDKPLQVVEVMVRHALAHLASGGYQLHDWHHYNPPADKVKEERERKAAKQREWRAAKAAERAARSAERDQSRSAERDALRDRPREPSRDDGRSAERSASPTRARSPFPFPSPSLHPSDGREREPALSPDGPDEPPPPEPTHANCAAHGERLCVPTSWHEQKARQLGVGGDLALLEWYPGMLAALTDDDLSEGNVFRLLDRKFTEWRKPANGSRRPAEQYTPAPDEDDWFDECQRLHQGECNGRLGHRTRMAVDTARAALTRAAR